MLDNQGRNIRYLRLSVTDRCNFRCRYCMPAEGVCKREHSEMLSFEELTEIVRTAVSLGVSKVRLDRRRAACTARHRGLVPRVCVPSMVCGSSP